MTSKAHYETQTARKRGKVNLHGTRPTLEDLHDSLFSSIAFVRQLVGENDAVHLPNFRSSKTSCEKRIQASLQQLHAYHTKH